MGHADSGRVAMQWIGYFFRHGDLQEDGDEKLPLGKYQVRKEIVCR